MKMKSLDLRFCFDASSYGILDKQESSRIVFMPDLYKVFGSLRILNIHIGTNKMIVDISLQSFQHLYDAKKGCLFLKKI